MTPVFDLKKGGKPLGEADKALIMIHGRGGSADDILTLARFLKTDDYALLAPQATGNTWYPHSFMAPVEDNEPALSAALGILKQAVETAMAAGIKADDIYIFGFSQGACLTLEFMAQNARKYGGAAAIIGGVIGQKIDRSRYMGDFGQTPVLLATSNPDFHVPVERVYATANIFREMNADVTEKVYENAGHNVNPDHIEWINRLILKG